MSDGTQECSSPLSWRAVQSEPFKISSGLCWAKTVLNNCSLLSVEKFSLTIHDHKLNMRGDLVYKCFARLQIRAHIVYSVTSF